MLVVNWNKVNAPDSTPPTFLGAREPRFDWLLDYEGSRDSGALGKVCRRECVLTRHGETVWLRERRLTGVKWRAGRPPASPSDSGPPKNWLQLIHHHAPMKQKTHNESVRGRIMQRRAGTEYQTEPECVRKRVILRTEDAKLEISHRNLLQEVQGCSCSHNALEDGNREFNVANSEPTFVYIQG